MVAEHQKSVSPDSEPQKGANLDASVSGGHCWPCLCDAAKTAGNIFIYFKCFYNLYFLQAVRVIQVFVSVSFFSHVCLIKQLNLIGCIEQHWWSFSTKFLVQHVLLNYLFDVWKRTCIFVMKVNIVKMKEYQLLMK